MKLARLSLVCTLLVLVASPLFALPCQSCTGPVYPYCEDSPGSGTRCSIGVDWCRTVSRPCSPFAPSEPPTAMLAEWTVASIEISRPGQDTKIVTSPAAVADLAPSAPQK